MKKINSLILSICLFISILIPSSVFSASAEEPKENIINGASMAIKNVDTGKITYEYSNDNSNALSVAPAYNPRLTSSTYEGIQPFSIFGDDGRHLKTPADSRVAYIVADWPNGESTRGTAWIFAEKALMTAGHCIYDEDRGGWANSVAIYPGRTDNSYDKAYYANRFVRGLRSDNVYGSEDWGILEVAESIGKTYGYFGFSADASTSDSATLNGYHGDKNIQQWYQTGANMTNIDTYIISHKFDTTPGSSGSPIYKSNDISVAINISHNSSSNFARKIDINLFNTMNSYRQNPDRIFYTIKYNSNGGTGSMADSKIEYNVGANLRANTFTKYGNQFNGWYAYRKSDNKWLYKKPDGSSNGWYVSGKQPSGWVKDPYKDKTFVSKTTSVNNDIVTMYAQWKPSTYTIKYNSNGGTGSMSDTKVTYGTGTALRANTFTKYGNQFNGWYAYRKGDNKWYYKDPNGSDTSWCVEGKQPNGWVKTIYNDKAVVSKTTGYHNDIVTMYAQWKPSTYTIKYNSNGGTGSMSDTKVTYGTETALRANSFTKTGYKFIGWYAYRKGDNKWYYKDPNGSDTSWCVEGKQPNGWVKTIYNDKAVVSKTTGYHNDIVNMYAQWQKL